VHFLEQTFALGWRTDVENFDSDRLQYRAGNWSTLLQVTLLNTSLRNFKLILRSCSSKLAALNFWLTIDISII